uniref:CSON010576 protein n=1 Tax=Culicoides sonorensis TaxID=179676 RepID=A0A336KJ35_CULSO
MESEVISGHKTLLQKYEIPLEHLDFDYLRKCSDTKKVERIYRILKSGEEGNFPDLTKFAEKRLHELDPKNKFLRTESAALRKNNLNEKTRMDLESGLKSWHDSISDIDHSRQSSLKRNLPPVRALNKEILDNFEKEKSRESKNPKKDRIKSCEYEKWDKFDADAEALKIDLDEERKIENFKQKTMRHESTPIIEEIYEDDFSQMTLKEKEVLAKRCKDKGNDFYRAKEYKEAIEEYSKSLRILSMAATYNNRAIAYIKTNEFHKAVKDCDKCLELEPENVKALLRKAQALQGLDQRRDAYQVYCKVLLIEPNNSYALNATNDLRKQLPDLPLPNSTRIKVIDETETDTKSETLKHSPKIEMEPKTHVEIKSEEKKVKETNNEKINEKQQTIKAFKDKLEIQHSKPKNSLNKSVGKDDALQNYKMKVDEQKKKQQEYKEHFKKMFEEHENEVFLLPHHNKNKNEFIIEESKDQKKK